MGFSENMFSRARCAVTQIRVSCAVMLKIPSLAMFAFLVAAPVMAASAFEEDCFPEFVFLGVGGDPNATSMREVEFDSALFTGVETSETFRYDVDAALQPLTPSQLRRAPSWILATRLILSEVGPDRLLDNKWGPLEAIGIIQSVYNRLDPAVWNPAGRGGLVPWPGCGTNGNFNTCANPQQYLGLRTDRAHAPRRFMRDQRKLEAATDIALTAWWLHHTGSLPDITNGATSFVHRCGGTAYGRETALCDGDPTVPDRAGSNSSKGPMYLKGPGPFSRSKGHYSLVTKRTLDYRAKHGDLSPGEFAKYLWGAVIDYTSPAGEG